MSEENSGDSHRHAALSYIIYQPIQATPHPLPIHGTQAGHCVTLLSQTAHAFGVSGTGTSKRHSSGGLPWKKLQSEQTMRSA